MIYKVIDNILKTLTEVGSETVAYKNLFDQVLALVNDQDQERLRIAYAELKSENDNRHDRLQEKLEAAAGESGKVVDKDKK